MVLVLAEVGINPGDATQGSAFEASTTGGGTLAGAGRGPGQVRGRGVVCLRRPRHVSVLGGGGFCGHDVITNQRSSLLSAPDSRSPVTVAVSPPAARHRRRLSVRSQRVISHFKWRFRLIPDRPKSARAL